MTARRQAPSPQLTLFLAIEGKRPEHAPEPPPDIDLMFTGFYAAYPRHVGPKRARKAFETALKETTFDQIMRGVAAYVEDIRRKGTRPEFIAHPTSWLNAGRWADEYQRAAPDPTTSAFGRAGLEYRARAGLRR